MSEQLQLPFKRHGLHRLFFALVPPPHITRRAMEIGQQAYQAYELEGPVIPQACLHISLYGLGKFDGVSRAVADAALAAGDLVSMPPFELTLAATGSFNCGRTLHPFVLQGGGRHSALTLLRRILGEKMIGVGLGRWANPGFTMHMKLFHADRMVDRRPMTPLRWTVEDFVLIDSTVGQARHRHLARWPLRDHLMTRPSITPSGS